MKLPFSLLKSFLPLDLPIAQISETLVLLGIEVDQIIHEKPPYAGIVVAEVSSCSPHPQAEKLRIAQVNDGKKTYEVVCGAANCRAGIRIPFAPPGAILTGSDGKPMRIEVATLRGVVSSGMICSAEELHLREKSEGVLELPLEMELGCDLISRLWDPVFEISLTPNLGHCFSALGIARELSAALQIPMDLPPISLSENQKSRLHDRFSVLSESKLCHRYMGRWIEGIQVAPSPFWLQQLLISSGMNPINNVVDAVNYVLLKRGQPMHAFDAGKIEGKKIRVVECSEPQKFLGLDGVERLVPKGALLTFDEKKAIAIIGIIGGENSAVSAHTREIFLESAVFDPLIIRKTARAMGLRTESAQHFEKGVDPVGCEAALEEACYWIAELTGGKVASGVIDVKQSSFPHRSILCRMDRINQRIGLQLSQSEIEGIFRRLHFKTHLQDEGTLRVEVPPFRSDLSEEIDLAEEIARIYGYNNIPKGLARCINSPVSDDPIYLFENCVRQNCTRLGLQEFLTADLIGPKLAALAQEFSQCQTTLLKTIHSKSEEYSILRPSLLPGLIQVTKHNFDRKNFSLRGFEIGRIYFQQGSHTIESTMAALFMTGHSEPSHWSKKSTEVDFYDLKGILESLIEALKLPAPHFKNSDHVSFHPGRQANLYSGDKPIGSFGEIHPALTEKMGIEQRILFAELDLQPMLSLQKRTLQMTPLPQFPSSERDWTVSLPLDREIESIFKKARSSRIPLLEKVELIDLYYPAEGGQKNVTFRFTYRDLFKTISFEEVEAAHHKLLAEIVESS